VPTPDAPGQDETESTGRKLIAAKLSPMMIGTPHENRGPQMRTRFVLAVLDRSEVAEDREPFHGASFGFRL